MRVPACSKLPAAPLRIATLVVASSIFWIAGTALAGVVTVGATGMYDTISAAVAAASANDVIDVDAGVYINDFPTINVPLTINGVGGIAVLKAEGLIPNGKAILIANTDATLNGLQFEGATVGDGNGAGIRYQGGNLRIENSVFSRNQDGLLAADDPTGNILISNSTFIGNGSGSGFTHAVYVNGIDSLRVEDSTFNGTLAGHDIKSRAANSFVIGNYLDDGLDGTTSYAVDISNGGNAMITGNQIVQGPDTGNSAMISYAAEGELYGSNSLLVANNFFTNSRPGGSVGVFNHTADVAAQLICNTFNNVADPLVGPGTIDTNNCSGIGPVETPETGTLSLYLIGLGLLAALGVQRRLAVDKAGTYARSGPGGCAASSDLRL